MALSYKDLNSSAQTRFENLPKCKQPLPTRGLDSSYMIWLQEKAEKDTFLYGHKPTQWVINKKIYDLTEFVDKHPGGSHWLQFTRGHNITEHYMTHHLNLQKTDKILQKYYVRDCPQNSQQERFTFEKDGLFCELREKLLSRHTISQLQDRSYSSWMGLIFIVLWFSTLLLAVSYRSYLILTVCAYLTVGLVGVGHNFVHQRPSFFKYLFLAVGFSPREWEIMHCISHHQYSNTLLDFELQVFEPICYFLRIMPQNSVLNVLAVEMLYILISPINIVTKLLVIPLTKFQKPQFEYAVPLIQILLFKSLGMEWQESIKFFLYLQCVFGFLYLKITTGPHRIQKLWTEGSQPIRDYGQHTLYTSSDVYPQLKGGFWSYFVTAGFNIHIVHHMFPTIDNRNLWKVDQILKEICQERGLIKSQITLPFAIYSVFMNYLCRQEWNRNKDLKDN